MGTFKEEHKRWWMDKMGKDYPNLSYQTLELEYYKAIRRVKTIGVFCIATTLGYFAGKRK